MSVRPSHSWDKPKQFNTFKYFLRHTMDVSSFLRPNFVILNLGNHSERMHALNTGTPPPSTATTRPIISHISETVRDGFKLLLSLIGSRIGVFPLVPKLVTFNDLIRRTAVILRYLAEIGSFEANHFTVVEVRLSATKM